MLAEMFFLKLEALLRVAAASALPRPINDPRFVPATTVKAPLSQLNARLPEKLRGRARV